MSSDSIELHKIHAKISKLRKVQAEALSLPTFSPAVSEQFLKILDKIRVIDEQNKYTITHNRLFVDKISKFIPEIVELSQNNYLQTAIVDLQTQLSSIYSQAAKLSELASSVTASRGKIVNQLKSIMSRALMISYHKVSPTVFIGIQQNLITVTNDLTKLGFGAWKEVLPQFPTLIPQINDVDTFLKHLTAAHTFIFTAESLQNSLRRVQQKNPGIQLPLRSHQVFLEPSKPSNILPEVFSIANPINVEETLEQLRKNPNSLDEVIPKLESAIAKDFRFQSPSFSVQEVIYVVLTIHPPIDIKSKLFTKSFRLFKELANSIQCLCQLPQIIYSKAEISNFEIAISGVERAVESIAKARKKPAGWTAEKAKIMIHKFEEFILNGKNVIKAAETIEKINKAIEPHKIPLDLTRYHLKPVESRYTIVSYPSQHKVHYVTIIRALNLIAKDLEDLKSKNYIFRSETDPTSKELHAVSFKKAFDGIQEITAKLESDIFRFSISTYNEFPVSKSGVTILSCFAELQRTLEFSLLSMHFMPNQTLNFRLMSMYLFEQGFPLTADENIDGVLKNMSTIFDVYVMFNKLDSIGAVSLNSSAQICFLATMCDELSDYNDVFVQYRDFFTSVDLFDIDNDAILEQIQTLHQDTLTVLENWTCTAIVSKFTQYTKTIYTCLTQLKRVSVEPLLTKLLAQLSSWLGNLSRTLPKPTNLREMQIRMSVLHQVFSVFLENNLEMKKQIPFEQLTEVIGLFKRLRDVFTTKTRLKQLLTFIERVQVNTDDFVFAESSSTEAEANQLPPPSPEYAIDAPDIQIEPEEAIRFQFSTEEVNMWIQYAQSILKPSFNSKKKEYTVNSLSPKLIYTHFKNLVTKYCDMWRLEKAFSKEILDAFGPMLHQEVELTIPGLSHFFTSNVKRFEAFRERITVHIEQHLELVSKSLSEFAPVSRGRGFQRELPPAHPNAPLIADVNKALQSQNISGSDFSWYPELIRLYHQLNPLLDEMSIASDGNHPCSLFRRLCRKAYLCFLCTRCFQIFSSNTIPYGPDIESLRCLITDFMENHFANDNTVFRRHQIEEIMNSDIGCDTFVFESSMKHLRCACSLINIKVIVENIDADFFSFDEFFGKLPINSSSLATLLESSLFDAAEAARNALFVLVTTNYDDTIAHKCIMALQSFISGISNAPFDVDKSTIYNSIKACRTIQSLSDVSTTFDCLDVFTPKTDDSNLMNGSWVLRVRILLLALESRMEILMTLATPQFKQLFKLFRPVMLAVEKIPDRFGFIDASQPAFEELRASWKEFCDNFPPINIIPQWARCKQIAKIIPNVLLGSVDHPDIHALSKFTRIFNVTHDPTCLIRMKLAFLFVEKQVKRYMPNPEFVIFPFVEMQDILTVLLKFHEVCLLIPPITERINTMGLGDPISDPKEYRVLDITPFEDQPNEVAEINNDSNIGRSYTSYSSPTLLTTSPSSSTSSAVSSTAAYAMTDPMNDFKPLSFEDQVVLAQMIDAIADANSADKEQLAQLPFLKRQVHCLEPFIQRTKQSNENLEAVNEYLSEPIRALKAKMSDEGKSQTRIDEMIELNSLKAQARVEDEEFQATQSHFDKLNRACADAEVTLERHASVQRQKRLERQFLRENVDLEKVEAALSFMSYEEKVDEDCREKLRKLAMPLHEQTGEDENENGQGGDENGAIIKEIKPLSVNCEVLEKKKGALVGKISQIQKIEENAERIEEDEYTLERLQKQKEKYLKSEETLQQLVRSMKRVFE